MCGIAGIMNVDGSAPEERILKAMKRTLAHRGPDGNAIWMSNGVGLVHTRLAIIDIETGAQPLIGPGENVLIANAEIYNYQELKAELPKVEFKTFSDCEPVLHYYSKFGLGFCDWLRGMYAIAIYDPQKNYLVLSRDPFGIKPLYFSQTDKAFAFASEPNALLAAGFGTRRLRENSVRELLQLQFTIGSKTLFEGIERVLPGETILVLNGRVVKRQRKEALPLGGPMQIREKDAIRMVEKALLDSVDVHQRSDVPYAMFLSGGIDSSALLASMTKLNQKPVTAYTIGFASKTVQDERAHARRVAKIFNADQVEINFDSDDFWSLLPTVAASMTEPTADYAILPTWKLAKEASRRHKVILSGEGGDELFGGYGRYRRFLRPRWLGGGNLRRRGIMDDLGVLRGSTREWYEAIAASESEQTTRERSRLQVGQAVDCGDWLPNDLLTKLDRCLMAHGVEGRTPFLDNAITNTAFLLPDNLKIQRGIGKWILRKWLDEIDPNIRSFSPKKGLTVPVGEWIALRGKEIGPLVARQPGVAERCNPIVVEELYQSSGKREQFAAWALLFFALWHQYHIVNVPVQPNVFEMLS